MMQSNPTNRHTSEYRTYRQTKMRLVAIYSCVFGIIISFLLSVASYYVLRERTRNQLDAFHNNVQVITDKLTTENIISNDWLSALENNHHLLIYIEDNGSSIKPHSSWMPVEDRNELFGQFDLFCIQQGVDIHKRPVSYKETVMNYYEFTTEGLPSYHAASVIIPLDNSYRSILLLQNDPSNAKFVRVLILNMIVLTVFLWAVIIFINFLLVSKALRPVQASNKKQTEFIAAASHELKAPLAAITSCMHSIELSPDYASKYAVMAAGECRRLGKLVDDLLILASTETNTWQVKLNQIEIDTVLLDLFEVYEQRYAESGMKLQVDLGETISAPIDADEERLKQVIIILLDNALQYSKSEEPVLLKKREIHNSIYIDVIDHGVGIPTSMAEAVFDKFQRGEAAHRDKEHFGLGLSIARELTLLQGGTLKLRDTEGGGSTFTIRLPRRKDNNL